jgi:hypothetical protein
MGKAVKKIDFKESQPELYRASREVEEVQVTKGTFLVVDGVGGPGGQAFQEATNKLFSLAYTTKFMLQRAAVLDFAIPNLECLWFENLAGKPASEWPWRLMIRIPDQVTGRELKAAGQMLADRRGLDTAQVQRKVWKEGRALQVLHVGPYEGIASAYAELQASAEERGLTCTRPGHEVYLSDPRRVAPEKIKTIVRMPVARKTSR